MRSLEGAALAPAGLSVALLHFLLRKVADGARAGKLVLAKVKQVQVTILLLDSQLVGEYLEICRHGVLAALVLREGDEWQLDLLGRVQLDLFAALHFRRDGVGLAVGLLGLVPIGLSDAGSSHLNNNYSHS